VGDNSAGVIYPFNPSASTITMLASFDASTTGNVSYASLTAAPDGTLYGTASLGRTSGDVTVFALNPPEPASLPLVGAGAAFGWSRQLPQRLKPGKTILPVKS